MRHVTPGRPYAEDVATPEDFDAHRPWLKYNYGEDARLTGLKYTAVKALLPVTIVQLQRRQAPPRRRCNHGVDALQPC